MFGGIGFLIGGNLACGVIKDDMVVRVDPEKQEALLKKPHAKPFAFSGKPMKGWLLVGPPGCKTDKQLSSWIKQGIEVASALPPKQESDR